MFFHLFKYKLKNLFHTKELVFWNLMFPLILATLFFSTFGNKNEYKDFSPVSVAVVKESDNETFTTVLDELSKEGDDQLFNKIETTESEALDKLKNQEVKGIIYVKETPSLTITQNGMEQTILQSFMKQYISQSEIIKKTAATHPENIPAVIEAISKDVSYGNEISLGNESVGQNIVYFYSLIAMACIYSAMSGVACVSEMMANQSTLGMRRDASPQHKLTAIVSDFSATVVVQFFCVMVLLFYLTVILRLDFGSKIPLIILISFIGCIIGTALGILIGAIPKFDTDTKIGISVAITMVFSLLSGLMMRTIKYAIDAFCPVINKINPVSLITDSLYALNMYDTYERFTQNIVIMLIMALICCIFSYIILRRKKYANL